MLQSDEAADYINQNFPDTEMNWVFDKEFAGLQSDWYFTLLGGTSYYPRTVIVDQNGIISYTIDGPLSYDELKGEITKLQPDEGGDKSEDKNEGKSDFIVIFDIVLTVILAVAVFFTVIYFGMIRKPKKKENVHRQKRHLRKKKKLPKRKQHLL